VVLELTGPCDPRRARAEQAASGERLGRFDGERRFAAPRPQQDRLEPAFGRELLRQRAQVGHRSRLRRATQ